MPSGSRLLKAWVAMLNFFLLIHPIELAFNQVKTWLKRYHDFVEAFSDEPMYPITCAFAYITKDIAAGYFQKAHYL